MRPWERWCIWLRTVEAAGNTGAIAAAHFAVLAVHGVEPRNTAELEWRVCLDRRGSDELAGLYLQGVGLREAGGDGG